MNLKAVLFQLNLPAFLRESARIAELRSKAISIRAATNAIALADFLARAELSPRWAV